LTFPQESTAIDNIFIDIFKNTNYTIKPLPNGLSDHDAQIPTFHNIKIHNLKTHYYTKRLINEYTISEFKFNLSHESWVEIFTNDLL
jgi:arginine deiminase